MPNGPAKNSRASSNVLHAKLNLFLAADDRRHPAENFVVKECGIFGAESIPSRDHARRTAKGGEAGDAMGEETPSARREHDMAGPQPRQRIALDEENVSGKNRGNHAGTARHDPKPAIGPQHLFRKRHLDRCTFLHCLAAPHGLRKSSD